LLQNAASSSQIPDSIPGSDHHGDSHGQSIAPISISRSTKHEFVPELLRDESCPPNSSQAHPQTELVSAIASDASNTVATDSIDEGIEWKRVQLVSEVRKLGGIPLMSVVEQQRGGPGTGHERIVISHRE
jgi:hypothetical protein